MGYGTLVDDGTEYPYGKAVTSGDVVGGPNADAGEVIVMGGVASSVTVELGGSLLLSGGSAVDATIQDGGGQVLLGGTSYNTDVGAGGSDDVQGGRASGTLVESGGVEDVDGSTAFGIGALVETGGLVSVTGGGSTNATFCRAAPSRTPLHPALPTARSSSLICKLRCVVYLSVS